MNKIWSEQNKSFQQNMKKATFSEGISLLLTLRDNLMSEMDGWRETLSAEQFYAQPFVNAEGFHHATVAYSLWHVFRIEDIVAHTLIQNDEEIFFEGDYGKKTGSPIITTGNELYKQQIARFSETLDIPALYEYIHAVKDSGDALLRSLKYEDLKRRFDETDRERIRALGVVSPEESACWLIDYWCGKDVKGLLQMPFSRHWIMHTEAALRIINKLK